MDTDWMRLVEAARSLDAERTPRTPVEIRHEAARAHPPLSEKLAESLNSSIHYHAVNMRSRTPKKDVYDRAASWNKEPRFVRVEKGRFLLLTPDEVQRFREAWRRREELLRRPQYPADELWGLLGTRKPRA